MQVRFARILSETGVSQAVELVGGSGTGDVLGVEKHCVYRERDVGVAWQVGAVCEGVRGSHDAVVGEDGGRVEALGLLHEAIQLSQLRVGGFGPSGGSRRGDGLDLVAEVVDVGGPCGEVVKDVDGVHLRGVDCGEGDYDFEMGEVQWILLRAGGGAFDHPGEKRLGGGRVEFILREESPSAEDLGDEDLLGARDVCGAAPVGRQEPGKERMHEGGEETHCADCYKDCDGDGD